jgi:hypothetical protein
MPAFQSSAAARLEGGCCALSSDRQRGGCRAFACGYEPAGRTPSVKDSWIVWPSRRTSSVTVSYGLYWLNTSSTVLVPSMRVPLTAVMMSPSFSPAFSAGEPGTIAAVFSSGAEMYAP